MTFAPRHLPLPGNGDMDRQSRWLTVGDQSIFVGDCLELLDALEPESVGVVVTSPPYNIGVSYGGYDDRRPRNEYLDWMRDVARRLHRVLGSDGAVFLNVGASRADPWVSMDVAQAFREHFVLQNRIAWVKSISIGDDTVGHFKPINSQRYLNHNHEDLFHFTKDGDARIDRLSIGVPFKDKSNIARWGHERDRRCAGDTWFIPYETVRSKRQKFDHPAGFPPELPRRCLLMHGKPDAVVLDPFLGAGTTLVAARELGMRGIGCEVDPTYAETARNRLLALR